MPQDFADGKIPPPIRISGVNEMAGKENNEAARLLRQMTYMLNPRAARGVSMVFSFRLHGDGGGEYTLAVRDGVCDFLEGVAPDADLLIEGPVQSWLDICLQRVKPWQPFLGKKLRLARGGVLRFMKFGRLFCGDPVALEVPEGAFGETENEAEFRKGVTRPARRVLAVQGAPRGRTGATERMFVPLVDGMRGGGAEVDSIHLADLDIKPCRGCYACWQQSDGVCVIRDDMDGIISRFPGYDLVLYAVPLYADSVPGLFKNYRDRHLPLLHPYIFSKDGHCRHPSRHRRMPNIALAALCGFYEMDNFKPLVDWLEASAKNCHMPLVATLLRPHAMVMLSRSEYAATTRIYVALREAGRQLAATGRVAEKTARAVAEPIVSRGHFMAGGKHWWQEDF